MSSLKGYSSQQKEDRLKSEFVTVSPVTPFKHALDVSDKSVVHVFAADAAEALSTTSVIVATGHAALVGDKIRFTSGALQTYEVDVVEVSANEITLGQTLPSAPGIGDTFNVLRPTSLTVGASGGISATTTFILDGATQEVVEDTVDPTNNRPLPVKLTGFDGDVAINAANLNLEVQLEHDTADFDSVQIGNGTNLMAVNASLEAQVRDDDAITELAAINAKLVDGTDIGDVTINNTLASPANVIIGDGTETANVNASNELQVADDAARTSLSAIAGDTANLDAPLSTLATEATLLLINGKLVDGTDIGDVTINNTNGSPVPVSDAGASLTVDAVDLDIRDLSAAQDNVAISDGTNTAAVNVSLELQVRDDDANTALGSILSDTTAILADTAIISGWDTNAGAVGANTQRVHLTDESLAALESITVDVDLDQSTDSVAIGDGVEIVSINASNEMQVRDDDANTTLSNIEADIGLIETNIASIEGTVSGTELQVDIVASLPAGTNTIGSVNLNNLDVVDLFDVPVLDASSTNIPGNASLPLQVVASLADDVSKVHLQDTTGFFLGLYTGAAASEVLKMVINPGSDSVVECSLPAATRISVRRLDGAAALAVGNLSINFLG